MARLQPGWGRDGKIAMFVAPADKRPAVARYAGPAIIGTLGCLGGDECPSPLARSHLVV
jgi:hypothetical protein